MRNFKDLVKNWNESTLVILDIDSTLVLTHGRNQAILKHLSTLGRQKNSQFYEQLGQIECRPMEYGYGTALERAGLAQAPEEFLKEVQRGWRQHFFSNEFLMHDTLHEGALDFVFQLQDRKVPFVYLTGRYETTMRPGTLETLTKLGFPITDDILFLKPKSTDIDEIYKSKKIEQLKQKYDQTVLIDNEPKVLNQIQKDHPDVQLVFVDTCHSPNVSAPADIPHIKNFT